MKLSPEEKVKAATERLKGMFDAQLEQDKVHAKLVLDHAAQCGFMLSLIKHGNSRRIWPVNVSSQAFNWAWNAWQTQCEADERAPLVFYAVARADVDLTKPISEQLAGCSLDAPNRTGLNGLHVAMQMLSDGTLTQEQARVKGWGQRPVRALQVSDRVEYRSACAEGAQAMFSTMLMPPVRATLLATNHFRRKKKAYG